MGKPQTDVKNLVRDNLIATSPFEQKDITVTITGMVFKGNEEKDTIDKIILVNDTYQGSEDKGIVFKPMKEIRKTISREIVKDGVKVTIPFLDVHEEKITVNELDKKTVKLYTYLLDNKSFRADMKVTKWKFDGGKTGYSLSQKEFDAMRILDDDNKEIEL